MKAARTCQGLATVGGLLALAVGTLAIVPAASSAATVHSCANHTISYKLPANGETPGQTLKYPVVKITVQGAGCKTAYKLLEALYSAGKLEGYKCIVVKFKVPAGKVPEQCTRGAVKVRFAGQGG
jgi:hypothetical protein